jgi:hypothetical protein
MIDSSYFPSGFFYEFFKLKKSKKITTVIKRTK